MEIVTTAGNRKSRARLSKSSFECAPEAMDAILGIRTLGNLNLRIDRAVEQTRGAQSIPDHYAPLEIVPARREENIMASGTSQHERLLRLLDREQAWYDAQLEAAQAAEQLLTLREHHQQQWLQSVNNPT